MIDEHEIPSGSRLYFGKSAMLKRQIEASASEVLAKEGFEEIVTPSFSYHQHYTIDEHELIRFSDKQNNLISLRADSTLDVVRLITKRLGRSTQHNKWFYIQPVFKYPTTEINQIGAEFIGDEKLSGSIDICSKVFQNFSLTPLLHICNIKIPKLLAEIFDFDLEVFEKAQNEKILALEVPWVEKLVRLHHPKDIDEVMEEVPAAIRDELEKMKKLLLKTDYKNVCISPLYYVKMRYYDDLFFRFINKNSTLAKGGNYEGEELSSSGFALYTDAFIETLNTRNGS